MIPSCRKGHGKMQKYGMSDEDVDNINKLVKNCRYRIKDFGLCKMAILPCERAIDKGKCMTIIEYMDKKMK